MGVMCLSNCKAHSYTWHNRVGHRSPTATITCHPGEGERERERTTHLGKGEREREIIGPQRYETTEPGINVTVRPSGVHIDT